MGIGTKDLNSGDFGTQIGKGVFAKCQPIYGWDIVVDDNLFDQHVDYGFTIGFDTGIVKSDGSTYIAKKTWSGDWKKDKDGSVSGWGKLFGLGMFFKAMGLDVEVSDNGTINPKQLMPLKGKKVWRIEYVKDTYEKDGEEKPGYAIFNTFFLEDTPVEKMKQVWEQSLAKGYPSNYNPSILDKLGLNKSEDVKEIESIEELAW